MHAGPFGSRADQRRRQPDELVLVLAVAVAVRKHDPDLPPRATVPAFEPPKPLAGFRPAAALIFVVLAAAAAVFTASLVVVSQPALPAAVSP